MMAKKTPWVLTTVGFSSLDSARQAVRALQDLGISADDLVMAITNRPVKSPALLSLEKMVARQLPLDEMIAALRRQPGIDLDAKVARLEQLFARSGLVFQVRSKPGTASQVVYILTAAAQSGGVIIPPLLGSSKPVSEADAKAMGELDGAEPGGKEPGGQEPGGKEPGGQVVVAMPSPERAAQAVQLLNSLVEMVNVRIFASGEGMVEDLHADLPQAKTEFIASQEYLERQDFSARSRPARIARQALDSGGVVLEIDLDELPGVNTVHVLSNYGLPGGVIIPPPLPPKPKPKKTGASSREA